jgi:L-ribulose-5-phosphate 3-epimerase
VIKSISYWSFKGGLEDKAALDDVFAEAKRLGFEAVELALGNNEVNLKTTKAQCEAIRERADKAGVALSSVATGLYWDTSLTDPKATVREKAKKITRTLIDVAKWLGQDAVLVVPGAVDVFFNPDAPVVSYDEVWTRSLESLKELAPYAEESRVHVCLENVWNKFLLSPLEMRNFVDEINSPYVGCYFDVGNATLLGFPQQWVRILGSRIKRVHVKGFKTTWLGDKWTLVGEFCDLLAGTVPWAETMKALRDVGYNGPVTAEMLPWRPGLLEDTSKAMDKILAMK